MNKKKLTIFIILLMLGVLISAMKLQNVKKERLNKTDSTVLVASQSMVTPEQVEQIIKDAKTETFTDFCLKHFQLINEKSVPIIVKAALADSSVENKESMDNVILLCIDQEPFATFQEVLSTHPKFGEKAFLSKKLSNLNDTFQLAMMQDAERLKKASLEILSTMVELVTWEMNKAGAFRAADLLLIALDRGDSAYTFAARVAKKVIDDGLNSEHVAITLANGFFVDTKISITKLQHENLIAFLKTQPHVSALFINHYEHALREM